MPDLKTFAGQFPYASELLGIFHPLLGWRGRTGREVQRRAVVQRVTAMAAQYASIASDAAGGAALSADARTGNPVIDRLSGMVAAEHPGRVELTDEEWRDLLTPETIRSAVDQALTSLPPSDPAGGGAAGMGTALQSHYQGSGAAVERMLAEQPSALNSLLLAPTAELALSALARFPRLADAVLSPIGLLHLFRQYFFEFESFLGPPVGHVWVSPGTTLELVESTVRRRLVERVIESFMEVTTRSETTTETKDELSEAVKQENADDMQLAVSASGGFNIGVGQGQASASFDLKQARRTATEQTHKRARSQTEKKSTEIRQSYKTTFRTVSEQTDTTSKRYVVQNTSDKLVNYELRRKMRRVGVQLQHLGTRLCWQYYIDDHAAGLRVSRLVHLAKLSDDDLGLKPPEAPSKPESYSEEYVATLAFIPQQAENTNWDEDYYGGVAGNKKCVWQWDFAHAPKPGYELQAGTYAGMLPQGDLGGSPFINQPPDIAVDLSPGPPPAKSLGKFKVSLGHINWKSGHGIRVKINLQFGPSEAALADLNAEFETRKKNYQEERRQTYQGAIIRAVRERIKAVGDVHARPFDDLREEERHAIYRRLIDKLTHGGAALGQDSEARHTTAEIVRQLFDVDAILYFVAPDWWDPAARRRANLNVMPPKPPIPDVGDLGLRPGDQLDWGYHPNTVGDPYPITEETRPAPMGASIGWLMQLDGDPMRNAFLNAAWAKVVVPMRPGREREAIAWLRDQAEQDVGLKNPYQRQPDDPQGWAGKTLEDVLEILISDLQKEHEEASKVDPKAQALPGERVFEKGFDPLAGGVRFDAEALQVFDQWVEVLPTDQVVAVTYEPKT